MPSSVQASGTLKRAMAINTNPAISAQGSLPMALLRKAGTRRIPVPQIKPADTAPMPRKAPCTAGRCPMPASPIVSAMTKKSGKVSMPAKATKAPRQPK